ncbi:MAG: carboxypeptidase regulatory-like domain-containing protein [Luteitalea sp.]|nr:carboxypeptidase regulatory-like domain-containing protein [Luteitalea sp.]
MRNKQLLATVIALINLVLPALFSGLAFAQDYRARVQGVVTDPSGAALPGATVTLINTNTNDTIVRQSDERGRYLFDFVVPGTYSVSAELSGFGKALQENVAVVTRGDHTLDFGLQLGNIDEQVTVQASAVQVQFNTTTLSKTIDGKMLKEMPVVARNPFSLALLDPAVVNRYGTDRNPYFQLSTTGVDIGGQTSGRVDVLIDGVPIGVGSRGSYSPPMDAVQEFTVQQNSVDAEFGHTAGGVMNLSTKAGTNEYHGTAYYFGRNPALNAVSNSVTREPNEVRNHIGGVTVGGPLLRNRLFTYFAYERWQNRDPHTRLMTLPTELERTGDFSQSYNRFGELRRIYDPTTTVLNPDGTVTRQPFPGNKIPESQLDPTSLRFMQDIPLPNGPGDDITNANNYKVTYPWEISYWNFSNRTDWLINDKWRMFARYSMIRTRLDNPNYANLPSTPSDNGGLMNSLNSAVDTVYTLSPRTVLNFRMGVVYSEDDYDSDWAKLGEEGLAQYWPNNPWYLSYTQEQPAIYYPNLQVGSASFGKGNYWLFHPRKYSYQGNISMDRGRHYMKVGGSFRHAYEDSQLPSFGTFPFSAAVTADTFVSPDTSRTGDAWASFLTGAMTDSIRVNHVSPKHTTMNQYAVFFQDDFRFSRRITINLGLRYEYETAPVESQDRLTRYLDLDNPIPEMQATPPPIPESVARLNNVPYEYAGAWVYADSEHRGMYDPPRNLILPRIGVAFRLNDKTALRAGYGRYAIPMQSIFGYGWRLPSDDGFNANTSALPLDEGRPETYVSDPFPASVNPLLLPVEKSLGRYTNLGNDAAFVQQTFKPPVNDRIHVSIQRQLTNSMVLEATYIVNLGHNLPPEGQGGNAGFGRDLNQIDPQLTYEHKSLLNETIENPFYQYLTPETFPGQLRNQQRVTIGSLLRPYPQYGALTQGMTEGRENRYQAVQLRLQRSFSTGVSFFAGYNYNREKTGDYFNQIDRYANEFTMIPSSHPRHRISMSGTYELPFGRDRRLLSNVPGVVEAILGGWSTSGIFQWNSGAAIRFNGQMEVNGDPRIDNPTRDEWFDTSAFSPMIAFTPRTNPYLFEGLTGPTFWNIDTTLSKEFRVSQRFRLEFRMEAYNLTNSFMPTQPVTDVLSSTFGRSINQANKGREFQYTMRLHF